MGSNLPRLFQRKLFREHLTEFAIRYYRVSKQYSMESVLTLGLIFFAVSVFFNRSTASGLFSILEKRSNVSQDFWAAVIILSIILIRTHLNWIFQVSGCFILIASNLAIWASVISAGFAWQGVSLLTITSVIFIKANLDEAVERYLANKGR